MLPELWALIKKMLLLMACRSLAPLKPEAHATRWAGSFFERSAMSLITDLAVSLQLLSLTDEELAKGIVTSSTGNHALAILYACQQVSRVR